MFAFNKWDSFRFFIICGKTSIIQFLKLPDRTQSFLIRMIVQDVSVFIQNNFSALLMLNDDPCNLDLWFFKFGIIKMIELCLKICEQNLHRFILVISIKGTSTHFMGCLYWRSFSFYSFFPYCIFFSIINICYYSCLNVSLYQFHLFLFLLDFSLWIGFYFSLTMFNA